MAGFFFLSFQQILKVLDETSSTHQTRGQTGNDKGISHYLAGSHYDTLETVKPTGKSEKTGGKTHAQKTKNEQKTCVKWRWKQEIYFFLSSHQDHVLYFQKLHDRVRISNFKI